MSKTNIEILLGEAEMKRVMTHAYGPATLIRLCPHRETKEMVWDVVTDDGEKLYLSRRYVASLEVIDGTAA